MVWALCWLQHVVTYPLVINPKQPTAKVLYTTNIDSREKMMKNSNCSFTFTKTTLSALHMDRRFIQRTSASLISYCFVMVPGLSEFRILSEYNQVWLSVWILFIKIFFLYYSYRVEYLVMLVTLNSVFTYFLLLFCHPVFSLMFSL